MTKCTLKRKARESDLVSGAPVETGDGVQPPAAVRRHHLTPTPLVLPPSETGSTEEHVHGSGFRPFD